MEIEPPMSRPYNDADHAFSDPELIVYVHVSQSDRLAFCGRLTGFYWCHFHLMLWLGCERRGSAHAAAKDWLTLSPLKTSCWFIA